MTNLQILVTLTLLSVLFQFSSGQKDLQITNVTSPASAQILVSWNCTSTSVSFFMLDLRVVNNATIAPITAIVSNYIRSKLMQGLRAGTYYNATLKSYGSSGNVLATAWVQSQTVPATPQIATSNGISSSEITVGWSSQVGVDYYFLMVSLGTDSTNRTFKALNCSIGGLQPSSLYSLTLYAMNSAGPSAASKRLTALTLTPPPMDVTVTAFSSYSANLTWSSVEKALMYGIFVYEDGSTTKLAFIRKTTSIMITLDNLLPCTKYIFGLTSYNWFYTAGEENWVLHETGRLDSPQEVKIQYDSNLRTALLSWKLSVGASSYVASAKTESGQESLCTSTSTSCEILNLLCEQKYLVSITALTSSCNSNSSGPLILQTAICAPQNVTVIRDCHINTISLYWNPVVHAVKYTVNAFAPDGSKEECVNWDTYCFFMNLRCGTEYEMSVFAFDGKMNGSSSPGIKVRTAPCDPQNVQAIAKCQDNILEVSWNPSEGATLYTAYALGSSGTSYNCSSVNTSCQITGLQCGESLSVSLIAYDYECPSTSSESTEIVAAPCPPKTISALTDCKTNSTSIQWDYGEGAILYVAHVQATDGSEYTCESFDLSCSLSELPCSQTYTVFVISSNYQCMSPYSPIVEIKSVPCIPQNIGAEIICDQNTILVTWTEDSGNMTFKATAQSDSNYYNCTTQKNQCEISNISCGQLYSISVDADNGQCITSSNQTESQYLVPCKPTDVSTKDICVNGSTEISWTASAGVGVNTYVAALESNDALQLMCQSGSGSCMIGGTKCGKVYKATVTAVSSNCQALSNEFHVVSVPCSPINLESHVGVGLVVVSWTSMTGALNYTTDITGVNGERHECYTSNTSCSITELMCAHQYNMAVTANGRYCHSDVSGTQTFQTAPCAPQNVTAEVDCVTNIAAVSWDKSLGAENYTCVAVGTDGEHHVCHATTTSCDIGGLLCGQLYLITVSAASNISNSETSLPVELHTAPCVPVQEPPQLNCYNNSASLSWSRTSGAISYMSNVSSPGEETLSCHTEDTGCTINKLTCGQVYSVTVTAINKQCTGPSTAPATIITVPCQPQNVLATMNCLNSSTSLSWNEAPGALRYESSLTSPGKEHFVCNSTEPYCEVTGLECGQSYNVTVIAFNNQCQSAPSSPAELYTVPCVPTELQTETDCESNLATLSWGSAPGAVSYTAMVTGPQEEPHYCNTTNSSCSFAQLSCGLVYNTTVVAVGKMCSSDISPAIAFHTVPCVASDLQWQFQCGADHTALSWGAASGGIKYTATISSQDGDKTNCSTTDTHCIVNALQCGQVYTVTVDSFGTACSSRVISPEKFHTEPCVPLDVTTDVNCKVNSAVVSWSSTPGAVNYTALLSTSDGEEHTCHTTSTSCNITGLSCSVTYNVSVRAFNEWCQSESSSAIQLITAPCALDHVHTEIDCSTNSLSISWNRTTDFESFTSYLMAPGGENRTCTSGQSNCTFPGLPCGHEFIVAVSAANRLCGGPMSKAVKIWTGPCIPLNVNTALDCVSNSALISWSLSRGALSYVSSLIGSQGERYNCSSQDTSCWMRDAPCGEEYTVVMLAQNDICSSVEQSVAALQTCPCAPQNLSIFHPCDSNVVKLQWMASPGAVHYRSSVISLDGDNYICNTTNTTCDIGGLQCGKLYNVTVTAFNDQQANVSLEEKTFQTAPCIPTNVRAELHCGTRMASLWWDTAHGATTYSALVTGINGWSGMCSSNSTTCDISDLECGQVYTVTITTSNSYCKSITSPMDIYTAPCVPQNVRPVIMCGTNMTDLSWDRTPGALNYTATVRGTDGEVHSCTTVESACNIETLTCGQTYYLTVTAYGEQCETKSTAVEFHTGPCVPQILNTVPACALDYFTLSWAVALGADYYFGTLTDQHGKVLTCNTTDQSCNISGTECGKAYTVTIAAYNDQCSSEINSSFILHTAPCISTNLISSVTCETHYLSVSWDDAPGAMTYTVTARSRQDENSIKTQNTFYEFKDLFCDEEYDIIISSESETCNSLGNSSLHVKTIPCPPRILEAYASCENNSGFIQWDISHNARSYKAVAEGVNRLSCNTTDTSCEIPKLECGQNYTVTVWAEDGICTGQSSPNVTFKTVPCVVQNITSTVMCQDNALHVSWNVSSGATAYSATAVGTQGDIVIADTPDPNCLLSPLQCGEVYSLTVLAMNDECKSSESAAMKIISAPCSPMHLTASSDCEIKGASASWERSVGAVSYIAVFHGPDGDDVSCTSTSTSCSVSGLHCGQAYNVTVTAFDGSCHSVTTNTTIVTTVPCTPTNIEASINCSAMDIMNVTWSPSRGAESYVVLAKGHDGHTLSCNTTTDTCIINAVHCGDNYTISLTAWNTDCSSDTVTIEAVETVPCTPDLVEVEIDCLTHEALVSWQEHNIHPSYHTAVTSDPLGMEHSCSTFLSSCHISGLECGLEYNFQVYSTNSQCSSLKSVVYKSMTAPCEPKYITASVHCENSDALITWTKTRGAVYYMATLSGNGTSLSCNATDTNCSYFGLQCGQTYNASVVAMDGKCTSVPSTISTFKTAPCQPQGLNIGLDCSSQTASMSWDESDGAQLYNVLIESLNGTVSSYTTSHIFFSSDVLPCGHTYGFTVMALGGTCNSSRSLTLYENSAPCTPMNVTYTKNCPTTMAFVTWSESEGAIDYHLTAIESGGMQTYCNSTNSTCWLMDLKCGLSYYVEVVAVGQRCSSNTSSLVLLDTAPCLPKNAAVHMECENSSATFSWERSRGALGYLAMVKKNEDFVYSCDTIETNCTAPDLSCGDSYSFSVLASDMQCNSSFTTPIVSGVVPCPPIEVETSIYRGSVKPQEVEISWNRSHCGTNYMATVQGQIGYDPEASFILNSYWTSYMDFYIPVPCSSSYNVTVTAQNLAGASDPTTPIAGYTAPCPPQVTPLVIKDGTILISWEQTPYADEYRVVEIDNNNIVCTTPGLSCNVPITASSFQVIAVNPAGESTPTFVSGYNGVSSK